jgi:EpsI family protein
MTSVAARERGIFRLAVACALAGLVLFQFLGSSTHGYIASSSLFYWWGFQWFNPGSETQHGTLIVAISAWLVWRNLGLSPGVGQERAPILRAGTAALVAGLLLHTLGFVAEQARVSIIGLLCFTWGVIALAGGRRWALASVFPVAFLVFAIPINALDSAGFWLRMWVVGTSGVLLHALGIGVLVNGTQLLSPDGSYDYDVAAACSGVRSLVALGALSLLVGYLRFRVRWLWLLMFAATFPLIYAGNVVRIVSIVIAARFWGQHGGDVVHEIMGYAVFAMILGGMFLLSETIARRRPRWANAEGRAAPSGGGAPGSPDPGSGPRLWPHALGLAAAFVLSACALEHAAGLPPSGLAGIALDRDGVNPVPLPAFLGSEWMGRRSEVTEIEKEVLPPDTGFSRMVYVSLLDPSKQVFLSIVLSGRDRTSIHRPEYCLVGQGWTIGSSFRHLFSYPGTGAAFPATVLRVRREVVAHGGRVAVPQLFAYYFVGSEHTVATHWERLAKDSWDRVAHGRSDRWAYVVVQTGSSDGDEAALGRIQAILNDALPVFQKHA